MHDEQKILSSPAFEVLGALWLKEILVRIEHKLDKLKMTVDEAIQVLADENVKLDDIGAKLTEGFNEITELLGRLQNLTPDQQAIVDQVKAKVDSIQPQAQSIADIVPNP